MTIQKPRRRKVILAAAAAIGALAATMLCTATPALAYDNSEKPVATYHLEN